MAPAEKFMFDRSFDVEEELPEEIEELDDLEEEPEEVAPTFSEGELIVARDKAFVTGKEEGVQEASEAIERQIHETLEVIGTRFEDLLRVQSEFNVETFKDSILVATGIARKYFPTLSQENGLEAIENMVGKILREIMEEPRVTVHVHPDLQDPLNDRLAPIIAEAGFEGRVVVMDDEAAIFGDCRVEWSSGAAERSAEERRGEIEEIIARNMAAANVSVYGEEEAEPELAEEPSTPEIPVEAEEDAAPEIDETAAPDSDAAGEENALQSDDLDGETADPGETELVVEDAPTDLPPESPEPDLGMIDELGSQESEDAYSDTLADMSDGPSHEEQSDDFVAPEPELEVAPESPEVTEEAQETAEFSEPGMSMGAAPVPSEESFGEMPSPASSEDDSMPDGSSPTPSMEHDDNGAILDEDSSVDGNAPEPADDMATDVKASDDD